VVKQSAYGHGLIPVARTLIRAGADFLGVGSLEEAIALRKEDMTIPLLLLSLPCAGCEAHFLKYRVRPTVVDHAGARALEKAAAKKKARLPVHVKVDTGMGRLGISLGDAGVFIRSLKKYKHLILEGIFTHFPSADTDRRFTQTQIEEFNKLLLRLEKEGISFRYRHCANSAGLLLYPESHFNMARPGLILYGIKPCRRVSLAVKPVMALKSRVIFVKKVPKGASISYGRTYITKRPSLIATVAVGYADGYPWTLSSRGKVIIKDSVFPVVGRVCMDHIMVDLGKRADIRPGEEVILMGTCGRHRITAQDVADWAGTIPYEIVTRLSKRIPRIYSGFYPR
jgi:alanine racemase